MITKIYFSIFLIALTSRLCYSQPYELVERVIYKCKYEVSKPSGFHQAESESFILLIGSSNTLFLGETKMNYDSVRKVTSDVQLLMSVNPEGIGGASLSKEKILISRVNKDITVIDTPITSSLYYKESVSHNWRVSNDYKIINGWECQKATVTFSGRVYEAWFTKEIALSAGPFKFFGLPGLIVLVQDADCLFNFELTNISKVNYPKNIELSLRGVTKSTKKRIQGVYKELAANPLFALESAGINISFENGPPPSLTNSHSPPVFIEIIE